MLHPLSLSLSFSLCLSTILSVSRSSGPSTAVFLNDLSSHDLGMLPHVRTAGFLAASVDDLIRLQQSTDVVGGNGQRTKTDRFNVVAGKVWKFWDFAVSSGQTNTSKTHKFCACFWRFCRQKDHLTSSLNSTPLETGAIS
jgi:hypothetical protein